jgi:hypothetical protein
MLLAIVAAIAASVPALAGSAVIGSVAGSMNATVGGQALLPNTTIFSGDSVQVRDGAAVLALSNASRMVLGRDTVASFLRDNNAVTVLLSQGTVSVFHPSDGPAVQVKAGTVSVAPAQGFKTLGEVAMLNGSVVISAKEGALDVSDHGATKKVAKGQTIVIAPKAKDSAKGGGWGGGGSTALEVGAVGASGVAAILAGIGMSRSNDAKNAANQAVVAANNALAAVNNLGMTVQQALAAAQAAASSADAAELYAGCTYNRVTTGLPASPFVPPSGEACPNFPAAD